MIAWFCPECFTRLDPGAERCPSCGAATAADERTYEEKLVKALDHHLSDRRIIAARILGTLGSLGSFVHHVRGL